MDNLGFIHERLDIKILILYILRRLPSPVDEVTLGELCRCDDGIGYFDYTDCLSELVENGHITQTEEGYKITDKGARNADTVETSLPYSVRNKALELLTPVEEKMRRDAMISVGHKTGRDGCKVSLSMSDGEGDVISMSLLCADEAHARVMEKNFKRDAENYYQRIVALLSEEI